VSHTLETGHFSNNLFSKNPPNNDYSNTSNILSTNSNNIPINELLSGHTFSGLLYYQISIYLFHNDFCIFQEIIFLITLINVFAF